MELYHLKTFVMVAEEGHLTRAADRLFTSQPAISAHIKALEEELRVTLFHRTPKGMQLTHEGEQLLPRAQQVLEASGLFIQAARSMQDELVGELKVALNNDAEFLKLPAMHHYLAQHYPRLALNFLAGMTETNIHNVRVGRVDGAFTSGPIDDRQIEVLPLAEVDLCIAAPAQWQDRMFASDIEQLMRLPWVYTTPNCAYFHAAQRIFAEHDCQPEKMLSSDHEDTLHSMVKAAVGIGVVRKDIALKYQDEGHFSIAPIDLPTVSLDFIYLKKRANDPVIRAFREALQAIWQLDPSKMPQQKAG